MFNTYINDILHNEIVDQLRIEFPSTRIFTIPTGWATFNLYQMKIDELLLDEISMFGPRETSIFTDEKGHQGDIVRETGGLIRNIYWQLADWQILISAYNEAAIVE